MVVHVEHAPVASRAMVTSFGLKDVAHQTVPASFVFWVAQMEAPEYGNLARVCGHGLEKGPNQKDEDDVKKS